MGAQKRQKREIKIFEKTFKKGVDISENRWYYKQVADASDYRTLKTEQEPRKKRMCGSSISSEMYDLKVKIISFNNKSQSVLQ